MSTSPAPTSPPATNTTSPPPPATNTTSPPPPATPAPSTSPPPPTTTTATSNSSASPPPPPPPQPPAPPNLSVGLIVGIVIGGLLTLVLLGLVYICFRKRKRRREHEYYCPPPTGPKGGTISDFCSSCYGFNFAQLLLFYFMYDLFLKLPSDSGLSQVVDGSGEGSAGVQVSEEFAFVSDERGSRRLRQ
ncbi:hypothetical protein C3L33_03637, partial [Rhododendron williamsianum]